MASNNSRRNVGDYKAAVGSRYKDKDIQEVVPELQVIQRQHGGLEPQVVVEKAKNPRSALHKHFEWDDSEAAKEYRIHQARNLIRAVEVIIQPVQDRPPITTRAFISVVQQNNEGRIYLPIERVMSDPNYRRQTIERAMAELDVWEEKYRNLRELAEIFQAIQRTREKV